MEKNSPKIFAVLNMKREQQQEKSFFLVAWGFFLVLRFFFRRIPLLSPFPSTPPPLGSRVQQLGHVAIICFCISLIWVAGIGAGSHF